MKLSIPHPERDHPREIKIDYWDSWSADYTLALIIHPVLVQLKNTTNSYPEIEEEDVYPEEADFEKKWDLVLQDMINSFSVYVLEKYWEPDYWTKENTENFNRGLLYFGRYFTHLWD